MSQPHYFPNYLIRKRWLLKRLKGLATELHSVINVFTVANTAEISKATLLTHFPVIRRKLSWKKFAFVISEIITLFANTLTVDDKYSRLNMQNFLQQVQTPSSQKQKIFSGFFIAFLKCARNLENFDKEHEHPSLIISEIIESERGDYLNVQKLLLQNTCR